jgi:hypothetical protein
VLGEFFVFVRSHGFVLTFFFVLRKFFYMERLEAALLGSYHYKTQRVRYVKFMTQ